MTSSTLLCGPPIGPYASTDTWKHPRSLDSPVTEAIAESAVMMRFREIIANRHVHSSMLFESLDKIGSGGEGYVFLAVRRGSDEFSAISAVKIFSPAIYATEGEYSKNMQRIARVASRVVRIQHNHIVDVLSFSEQEGVRFMVMEWIDGFELSALMSHMREGDFREHMSRIEVQPLRGTVFDWENENIRMMPGIGTFLLRQCLSALAALHRNQIVHGDVKPSNIMLTRSGNVKLIDIGSADGIRFQKTVGPVTPRYAAPEVLMGGPQTPQADLASVGYAFIELLSGHSPFAGINNPNQLYRAKQWLPNHLRSVLPEDVSRCEKLLWLCEHLIAVSETQRLDTAEIAILACNEVIHQLAAASLDCDYEDYLRLWMSQYSRPYPPAVLKID